MRLVLDHLTVTDTTPSQLVEIAAATGCVGTSSLSGSAARRYHGTFDPGG